MKLFKTQRKTVESDNFQYLDEKSLYMDSACQTLRPQSVIDAMSEYFHSYNTCGGRVKYDWGIQVDEKIKETRNQILEFLGKSNSEYVVAFTLNTTYGINLVLGQLPPKFKKIITSNIEHNSVFLSTIETAKRLNIPRLVLPRREDGSLEYTQDDLYESLIVLNSMSNIDGRELLNLKNITDDVHKTGGIILVDAAQGVSHQKDFLRSVNFDALFFSGHKFYGPSLGVIVIKRNLLKELDIHFIGGGMVEDVELDNYSLVSSDEDIHGRLEIGLQDFAGIIGMGAAIKWYGNYKPQGKDKNAYLKNISQLLFDKLAEIPTIKIINSKSTPIVSFYSEKIDAHRLAIFLSSQNIMVRSGYFCCHYYLKNLKGYPPLVRVSLGLHNNEEQVEKFIKILKAIVANI
jgi:cysteine desulfurase/selenocysteine lyase